MFSAETDEQRKDWIRAIKQCLYSVSGGGTVLCVCVSYMFCLLLFPVVFPVIDVTGWMSLHHVYLMNLCVNNSRSCRDRFQVNCLVR